jgi:hypothetical protein
MPRGKGKQSLKETLDPSLIIKTDEEVGDIPFWLIDLNYGVSVDKYGFCLVERKEMTRSIKDESDNVTGGEIYYAWQFCKSADSFEDALLAYTRVTERKLMSKLVKCQDFKVLVAIRLQIQKTINNSFKLDGINSNLLDACETIQGHEELKIKLNEVNQMTDKVTDTYNEFIDFIKEKRKIIVQEMPKQKKHPIKEEVI